MMEDALHGKNLVIVEDDELISEAMTDYFGDANTVSTYETAEALIEALPLLQAADVFILDYRLPGMDGIELFKKLKPEHGSTKFVCISGEMSVELAQEAQTLGFDALILKPFDFHILEQNIAELLS